MLHIVHLFCTILHHCDAINPPEFLLCTKPHFLGDFALLWHSDRLDGYHFMQLQIYFSLAYHTGQFHHKTFTQPFFECATFEFCGHQSTAFSNSFKILSEISRRLLCMLTQYPSIFWSSPSLGFPIYTLHSRQGSQASIEQMVTSSSNTNKYGSVKH